MKTYFTYEKTRPHALRKHMNRLTHVVVVGVGDYMNINTHTQKPLVDR